MCTYAITPSSLPRIQNRLLFVTEANTMATATEIDGFIFKVFSTQFSEIPKNNLAQFQMVPVPRSFYRHYYYIRADRDALYIDCGRLPIFFFLSGVPK
jgi:hypothetical protein